MSQPFPCRHCGASLDTCMEILDRDGGYCCDQCQADDEAGISSGITHAPEVKPSWPHL